MRRPLSILFIIVILFNTIGYLYVLNWCQYEIERKAEELIDTHASEISGNLILRIPMNAPYSESAEEYTRVEGEINFEGLPYRMVKQKVQDNFLYVVCVKDDRTRIATDEINEMIAAVSGQPVKESAPFGLKFANLLLKYCSITTATSHRENDGWMRQFVFATSENNYRYKNSRSLFHPPSSI